MKILKVLWFLPVVVIITWCDGGATNDDNSLPSGEVTLSIDQGIVFSTGEIVGEAGGKINKLDLIVYKYLNSMQLKTGVSMKTMDHEPMHRFEKGGVDEVFSKIDDVPMVYPEESEKNNVLSKPKKGNAIIIKNLMSNDYTLIFVKDVAQDNKSITIQYKVFP